MNHPNLQLHTPSVHSNEKLTTIFYCHWIISFTLAQKNFRGWQKCWFVQPYVLTKTHQDFTALAFTIPQILLYSDKTNNNHNYIHIIYSLTRCELPNFPKFHFNQCTFIITQINVCKYRVMEMEILLWRRYNAFYAHSSA